MHHDIAIDEHCADAAGPDGQRKLMHRVDGGIGFD
jgi:hypothetical protein